MEHKHGVFTPLFWSAGAIIVVLVLTVELCRAGFALTIRGVHMTLSLLWDLILCMIPIIGWGILAHRGFTWKRRNSYRVRIWPHWRLRPLWTR